MYEHDYDIRFWEDMEKDFGEGWLEWLRKYYGERYDPLQVIARAWSLGYTTGLTGRENDRS